MESFWRHIAWFCRSAALTSKKCSSRCRTTIIQSWFWKIWAQLWSQIYSNSCIKAASTSSKNSWRTSWLSQRHFRSKGWLRAAKKSKTMQQMPRKVNKSTIVWDFLLQFRISGTKRACDENALEDEKPRDKKEHIDLTNDEDLESEATDDQFQVIPMPEISMVEVGYDSDRKSRSSSDNQSPSCSLKIVESQSLNTFGTFDFGGESNHLVETSKNSNATTEIPNEVSPNGSNITMLSSTSLLHGSCVFNRNNTVATQAGLKTYWLCKIHFLASVPS